MPRGDVILDEIGHAIFVDKPVAGFDPRLPFIVGHLATERGEIGRVLPRRGRVQRSAVLPPRRVFGMTPNNEC